MFLAASPARCLSLHPTPPAGIRQHTSAYVSIRQHTSAYVSIRQHTSAYVSIRSVLHAGCITSTLSVSSSNASCSASHASAYVSILQLSSIRQHPSASVSIPAQHRIEPGQSQLLATRTELIHMFERLSRYSLRQYVYFCASKASKLSSKTCDCWGGCRGTACAAAASCP